MRVEKLISLEFGLLQVRGKRKQVVGRTGFLDLDSADQTSHKRRLNCFEFKYCMHHLQPKNQPPVFSSNFR